MCGKGVDRPAMCGQGQDRQQYETNYKKGRCYVARDQILRQYATRDKKQGIMWSGTPQAGNN